MEQTKITIKVISKSDRLPAYATVGAAGADICACLEEPIILQPGERRLIPTGLFIEIPQGIEAQIRAHGLTKTPLAGLSRGLVGVTSRGDDGALVINAPGSRGGVKDTVAVVGPLVPHVLEQLGGGDH